MTILKKNCANLKLCYYENEHSTYGASMRIKSLPLGFGVLLALLLVLASFWFLSPDSSYVETAFVFNHEGQPIKAKLIKPLGSKIGPIDCVVMVHGDGAMTYDAHGYFAPYFSFFTERNNCVLSWDKPGVDGAHGNWLNYSMADRAALVGSAIQALRHHPQLDVGRVGLMGFSQAGWVMPKINPREQNLSFYIFVSPAVNWMRQSSYMSELRRNGQAATPEALRVEAALDKLILGGGSYDDFLELAGSEEAVDQSWFTKDRWDFVVTNAGSDLTSDLEQLGDAPILLLLGGRDGQVDTKETLDVFSKVLGDRLVAHLFDRAGHSMIGVDDRKPMDDGDGLWLLLQVMLQGQDAFVPGYWAAIDDFIAAQKFD